MELVYDVSRLWSRKSEASMGGCSGSFRVQDHLESLTGANHGRSFYAASSNILNDKGLTESTILAVAQISSLNASSVEKGNNKKHECSFPTTSQN